MSQHTDGLIAALFTPFHEDGSTHFDLFPALISHLVKTCHKGIFACGTNGEGPGMTIDERKKTVDIVLPVVSYPAIPAQKAVMKMLGMDMGPSRLPLKQLSPSDELQLKEKLQAPGFFDMVREQ